MKKIIMALVLSAFIGSVSAMKQSLTPQQREQQREQQRKQQREQQREQQRGQRECCREILMGIQEGLFQFRGTLKSLKIPFCPQIDQSFEDYYFKNCLPEQQGQCCQCIFNVRTSRFDQIKARCKGDCDSSTFDNQQSLGEFLTGCLRR